jgi:acyl-CoA thioesterase-1
MQEMIRFAPRAAQRAAPRAAAGRRDNDRRARSYGTWLALVQIVVLVVLLGAGRAQAQANRPVTIVALGDSLTAGFNLPASAAFPAKLEKALKAKGHNVDVINAGVSGDTAAGGLARLDWSVPETADAVIVELGANDMLRGFDPKVTQHALDEILRRLTQRRQVVLLAGMRALPNLGVDYVEGFETIYPELAAKYDVLFYPFFLDGIAGDEKLNQRDRLHPTAAGVDAIVKGMLPKTEEMLVRVRERRGS